MQIYTKISNKQIICLFFLLQLSNFTKYIKIITTEKPRKMICIIKLAQKGFLTGKEHAVL